MEKELSDTVRWGSPPTVGSRLELVARVVAKHWLPILGLHVPGLPAVRWLGDHLSLVERSRSYESPLGPGG